MNFRIGSIYLKAMSKTKIPTSLRTDVIKIMTIIVALFSSCMTDCKVGAPEQGRYKDGENGQVPLTETQEEKGAQEIFGGPASDANRAPVHSPRNWASESGGVDSTGPRDGQNRSPRS